MLGCHLFDVKIGGSSFKKIMAPRYYKIYVCIQPTSKSLI